MRELDQRHGAGASREQLADVSQQLARLSDELQDRGMRFRLLPVEGVFNRFPRMVRDLASKRGTVIRDEARGGDPGSDRALIDALGDVLGLLIDGFVGEPAVAIMSNAATLGDAESTAGAAILADGSVWLIVDVPRVVEALSARLQGALARAG